MAAESGGFQLSALRRARRRGQRLLVATGTIASDDGTAWRVELELLPIGGAVVPLGIKVWSDASSPLTMSVVRSVPLQQALAVVRGELGAQGLLTPLGPEDAEKLSALSASFRQQLHPGRKGRSDEDYMSVVSAYLAAMQDPETAARPVVHVANELGLSPSTVRNLLTEAKKRGLIEREHGKAGVKITRKGIRVLEEAVARKTLRRLNAS